MKTADLYGEDGIEVVITADGDKVRADDPYAAVRIIGHRLYACSLEQAEDIIIEDYLDTIR